MVIQKYYLKNKDKVLVNCLGLSAVILSVGLSVAIAKTDNLAFGSGDRQLSLTKKAVMLDSQAKELQHLVTEIEQTNSSSKNRKKAKKINSDLEDTREQIDKIVIEESQR